MITAVVMAGGKSRRMGQPKLLLEHRGKTLLANAIQRASCVTNQVLTVVGAYGDLYRREAECSGAIVVENPNWTEGLSSSLRTAVRNLEPEVEEQPAAEADGTPSSVEDTAEVEAPTAEVDAPDDEEVEKPEA